MLLRKLLIPLILSLVLALPAYAVKTPGPEAAPGKGKISSPKEKPERVIVIRTANRPQGEPDQSGREGRNFNSAKHRHGRGGNRRGGQRCGGARRR